MEKSLREFRLENENHSFGENQALFRCNKCNGTFQKPILASVSSRGCVQTYHACPRCLTKVTVVKHGKSEESKETSISTKSVKKVVGKHENSVECKHFLGYLKKRPKDTAIPDECLTCDRMIECLTH